LRNQKKQSSGKISKAAFVYLIKGGKFYKIGLTNGKLPKRHKQIGTTLPFKSDIVHAIATSDVEGLERHWHNHFAHKRTEGEWFKPSSEDVMEFLGRERMGVSASKEIPQAF